MSLASFSDMSYIAPMKNTYLFIISFLISFSSVAQIQLGDDIDGEAASNLSGEAVAISANGRVIAIGAIGNSVNGFGAGHVRAFQFIGDAWVKKGDDINGEGVSFTTGESVALSADGNILAIGSPGAISRFKRPGYVKVYSYSSGSWKIIGDSIHGAESNDNFGNAIALSADGQFIAIGSPNADFNGTESGQLDVYQFNSGNWSQMGPSIYGKATADLFGESVAISSNGLTVAAGASSNNDNGSYAGQTRVFSYDVTNKVWNKLGSDINGFNKGDFSGRSVSLSANGEILAIGATGSDGNGIGSGSVDIYKFASGSWSRLGKRLNGEYLYSSFGSSVSLSSDGTRIAVSASANNVNYKGLSYTAVYDFYSGDWIKNAQINAEAKNDATGYGGKGVDISDNGIVAIGAPWNDGNGSNSGHVRVYAICPLNGAVLIENEPMDTIVTMGSDAYFAIKASEGTTYQWQIYTTSNFVDLVETSQLSGVKEDTLRINYTDLNNANQHFRCIVKDSNGCDDISNVVKLELDGATSLSSNLRSEIQIYPNPASDHLTIEGTLNQVATCRVFDVYGKVLLFTSFHKEVDVEDLANGTYFIVLSDSAGTIVYRSKFVKL